MNTPLLQSVHHIAIICSNYEVSKKFYTEVLGCTIVKETYRAERDSYKLDLAINDNYICLLYTSPSPRDTERSRMPSSA